MFQRPKPDETEEDLLKQQADFLKSSRSVGASVPQHPQSLVSEDDSKLPLKTFGIVGDVFEKTASDIHKEAPGSQSNDGFPSIFRVDTESIPPRQAKKKSLFALKLEKKSKTPCDPGEFEIVVNNVGSKVDVQIHEENVKKLKSMTEAEIMEEKKTLESTLSPEMLNFLKNRSDKKTVSTAAVPLPPVEEQKMDISEIEENIRKTVDKKWLELDDIEPEKLQWIGDIPDASSLEPGQTYSARFDFSGDLQPFRSTVDVRTSLHHHGDEPERPGYTIQELYQLSRSTVLQQRILALNTLANIIRKTKMGYYDSCFDGALLKKLVESDVFFLLRFAMDDRTTTAAAVHCLHELFVCRSDEVCLDRLRSVPGAEIEPFLFVPIELDKDTEEDELKDHQIIGQDIVRGVLRTDLLIRFSYILNFFDLDPVTVSKIFEVVTRVCRHSPEACEKVFDSSNFMSFVFSHLNSSQPSHEAVKLLRVMVSSSHNLAHIMASHFNFDFILRIIDMDEPLFKLKLECLALWKMLLSRGLLNDQFQSFTPCLTRLLWFYVAKVDTEHGRFDFELFAGIAALLSTAQDLKYCVEPSYDSVLQVCLEKWLRQLTVSSQYNFSVTKAVGCAFNYFCLKYKQQGVQKTDLDFMKKLLPVLNSFLTSRSFEKMCDVLMTFSHILHCTKVDRDPENLPSLCSVYFNGENYLTIVQDDSPLPLMHSLAEFLLQLSNISTEFNDLLKLYLRGLETYFEKVLNASETSSWFSRYEIGVLVSLLKVQMKCSDPKTLEFGFRLVPYLRTDDERVLSIIDALSALNVFGTASETFKTDVKKGFRKVLYHSCENFPRHWMYEPIAAAPGETLQCLSDILEHCPDLISKVPATLRYCHLCLVLLNSDNIFNTEIHKNLEKCLDNVITNFYELDLNTVSVSDKSFYELYRDLVTEYASSSYGDFLFGKAVTLPLAQRFDVGYRKLMWSEFMHALRVITLPKDLPNFIPMDVFTSPVETDESLLILYLNAVSKNVLTETRNGFIYEVAVENVRKFLTLPEKDEMLASVLRKKINEIKDETLKSRLLS